jgi:hypothetical protein
LKHLGRVLIVSARVPNHSASSSVRRFFRCREIGPWRRSGHTWSKSSVLQDLLGGATMGFTKTVKDHPVFFVLGCICVAWVAGFGARGFVMQASTPEVLSCTIEGLDTLENNFHTRLTSFEMALSEQERHASDRTILSSDQKVYLDSADRIRKDIAAEQAARKTAIEELKAKCENPGRRIGGEPKDSQ